MGARKVFRNAIFWFDTIKKYFNQNNLLRNRDEKKIAQHITKLKNTILDFMTSPCCREKTEFKVYYIALEIKANEYFNFQDKLKRDPKLEAFHFEYRNNRVEGLVIRNVK